MVIFICFILYRDETSKTIVPTDKSPKKQSKNLIVETDIDEISPINEKTLIKVCC